MIPILTDAQLDRLSDIYANIGYIFFASMVIAPIVTGIDNNGKISVVSGLTLSILFWILSVAISKKDHGANSN